MYDKATGLMSLAWQQYILLLEQRSGPTLTQQGQLQATAPIVGRAEGIGVTVQNISDTGNLDSLAHVDNANTDLLTDGTGSPLTGGKRGFQALDTNNRLVGSFRSNAVNIAGTPTSSTGLSNDGVSHAIVVDAQSQQFGDGLVSYNAGSVDPGAFGGPFYIYADDPTYAGGAVTFQFSTVPQDQTATNGRMLFGAIITASGSAKTGGGSSGGTTPGGAGGRGFIQG